jgi:hypothetical protein
LTILMPKKPASVSLFDSTRVAAEFLYREEDRSQEISISLSRFARALAENRGLAVVEVKLPDEYETRRAIVKKLEKIGPRISQLVLREVADSDRIRSHVPVIAVGGLHPSAALDCVLVQKKRSVELRGPVAALDHPVRFMVGHLQPGDMVRARDLTLSRTVEVCGDPDEVIFHLRPAASA